MLGSMSLYNICIPYVLACECSVRIAHKCMCIATLAADFFCVFDVTLYNKACFLVHDVHMSILQMKMSELLTKLDTNNPASFTSSTT